MIHKLVNDSAVKEGAGNINKRNTWYDDEEFSFVKVKSNMYGIQ